MQRERHGAASQGPLCCPHPLDLTAGNMIPDTVRQRGWHLTQGLHCKVMNSNLLHSYSLNKHLLYIWDQNKPNTVCTSGTEKTILGTLKTMCCHLITNTKPCSELLSDTLAVRDTPIPASSSLVLYTSGDSP